jgi:membrane-associated phospholipid phosphatase
MLQPTNIMELFSIIWDLISIIPLAICLGLLYNFLLFPRKNILDLVLLLYLVSSDLLVKILKSIPYPKYLSPWMDRPKGAKNCDYFSRNGPAPSNTPGMPSGHMTHICLFITVMILGRITSKNGLEFTWDNLFYYGVNFSLVGMMALARYLKKCHNISQILAGSGLGVLLGYLFLEIIKKFRW